MTIGTGDQSQSLPADMDRWIGALGGKQWKDAAIALLDVYSALGNDRDADQLLAMLLVNHKVWPRKRLARLYQSRQLWPEAALLYSELAELEPKHSTALKRRRQICVNHAREFGYRRSPLANSADARNSSWEAIGLARIETQLEADSDHNYTAGLDDYVIASLDSLSRTAVAAKTRARSLWKLCVWHARKDPVRARRYMNLLKEVGEWQHGADLMEIELLAAGGEKSLAQDVWRRCFKENPSDNLRLLAANLGLEIKFVREATSVAGRLGWINSVFENYDLEPIVAANNDMPLSIDNIASVAHRTITDGPLVSIVVPVYNGAACLRTALDSLARQSWANMEVFVVDDASDDDSATIASEFALRDPRFFVLTNRENGGPSAARNTGLSHAKGEFFTCHDADDWSHPRKLERQIRALLDDEASIGNMSRCLTALTDLTFKRRGNSHQFFRVNYSSLLFRREPVIREMGYWDLARFGADTEYLDRMKSLFGQISVTQPDLGPLAIVRQSEANLTAHEGHGLTARGHTLRSEYGRRYRNWHSRKGANLLVARNPVERPFPLPKNLTRRVGDVPVKCDVILASDFRAGGELAHQHMREIRSQLVVGARFHLLQMNSANFATDTQLSPDIDLFLEKHEEVEYLTSDQKVLADDVLVLWPAPLMYRNTALPTVTSRSITIRVVGEALYKRPDGSFAKYDPVFCDQNATAIFRRRPAWIAQDPIARSALDPFRNSIELRDDRLDSF